MYTYKEITNDNGIKRVYTASDNNAEYVITSAYGHDLIKEYEAKYDRIPTSRWYNRHFSFIRQK